jgi:ankyrin repeat protein
LFERGADLKAVDQLEMSVLHYAADGGYLDFIKFVLARATIDINPIDWDSDSALSQSLCNERLEAASFLVENGANLFCGT